METRPSPPCPARPSLTERVYDCERCGERMEEIHCKIVCARCGSCRDCSDP